MAFITNYKEELKEFNKLIKKYPEIKEFYLGRAKLYGKIKQYKKAFNDYKKVYTDYVSNSYCARRVRFAIIYI